MARRKGILPRDIRDYLSLLSIFTYIAIFSSLVLESPLLAQNLIPVFLILGGAGALIAGKVFTLRDWIDDGLQPSEYLFVTAIIFGLSSMIIGFFLLFGVPVTSTFTGIAGWFALVPAAFISLDYMARK